MTPRNDPNDKLTQPYAAVSTNGGTSFGKNIQISFGSNNALNNAIGGNYYGDYSGMDFAGGSFHPVWVDNSNIDGNNPNGINTKFDLYTASLQATTAFTGPLAFPNQWNLFVTGVTDAWRFTTGSSDVLLVSLDTGLKGFPGGAGGDDLDSARVLADFSSLASTDEHGNESISVMSAVPNNNWGIAGINWTSSVLVENGAPAGWLSSLGLASSLTPKDGIAAGIAQAKSNNQRVIFQGGLPNVAVGDVQSVISANLDNAFFAIQSGDDANTASVNTWATLESSSANVASVGAVQHAASFVTTSSGGTNVSLENASALPIDPSSNRGGNLTLVAPGGVPVTDSSGTIIPDNGTSAAAANLAAIASLVWSVDTDLTAGDVRSIMTATAIDLGGAGTRSATFGFGLVNADAAVRRAFAIAQNGDLATLYDDKGTRIGGPALPPPPAANPPVLAPIASQNINEGNVVNLPSLGMITQASTNPNEGWTFDIDWGDGGIHDTGAAKVDAPGGPGGNAVGHFGGNRLFSSDGTYNAVVKVQNSEGLFTTQTFTITVNEQHPDISPINATLAVKEGDPVDLGRIAFDDPDVKDTHMAVVTWGDGSSDTGIVSQFGDRGGGLLGSVGFPKHYYSKEGTYTITVTVQDQKSISDSQTTTVQVSESDPTIDAFTIPATAEGAKITPTITFHDKGTQDTHTATIDWGDGSAVDTAKVTETPFGPPRKCRRRHRDHHNADRPCLWRCGYIPGGR